MLNKSASVFGTVSRNEKGNEMFNYLVEKTYNRLNTIKGVTRNKRSIDWIGSAWKWVAGNPDASDWNKILESQQRLIENNEQQYVVNKNLFGTANELVKKTNELIDRFNNKILVSESKGISEEIFNQVRAIKEDVEEIVRACQLAKSGIVNTNLLDMEEVHRIVSEVESLPYSNEVEAIEYGKPSVFSNGTSLLYVLSIPKVDPNRYNNIYLRASISNNRQLDLEFDTVLMNHDRIYGIKDQCSLLNNVTICPLEKLRKIADNECLSRILRGINASCTFRSNRETIVEQIDEDLIYVTNFKGAISSKIATTNINGTYLIRFFNETIEIGERKFTNERITSLQALPQVQTSVHEKTHKIDTNFLHELHEENIKHVQSLMGHINLSLGSNVTFLIFTIVIIVILGMIWKRVFGHITVPTLDANNANSAVN